MVTPALAAAWLAVQPPGRFNPGLPDPARVAQIAADIEAGRFDTARGRPVSFNFRGYLDKGLHRLHAVLATGRPVVMRVTGEGLHVLADAAGAAGTLVIIR